MKTFNCFGLTPCEAVRELLLFAEAHPDAEIICRVDFPALPGQALVCDGNIVGYGVMRRGEYAGVSVQEGGLGSECGARSIVACELAAARGELVPEEPDAVWYARQEALHSAAISEDYASIEWEYVAYLIVQVPD